MGHLFKLLGVLLACYVALALQRGVVFAKSGPWGRRYRRDDDGLAYWGVIVCYLILSVALIFVF